MHTDISDKTCCFQHILKMEAACKSETPITKLLPHAAYTTKYANHRLCIDSFDQNLSPVPSGKRRRLLRTGHDPFLPNTFKININRSPCTILSYILLVDGNTVQGTRQISNPYGITFTKTVSRVDKFLGAFANQLPKATISLVMCVHLSVSPHESTRISQDELP